MATKKEKRIVGTLENSCCDMSRRSILHIRVSKRFATVLKPCRSYSGTQSTCPWTLHGAGISRPLAVSYFQPLAASRNKYGIQRGRSATLWSSFSHHDLVNDGFSQRAFENFQFVRLQKQSATGHSIEDHPKNPDCCVCKFKSTIDLKLQRVAVPKSSVEFSNTSHDTVCQRNECFKQRKQRKDHPLW